MIVTEEKKKITESNKYQAMLKQKNKIVKT